MVNVSELISHAKSNGWRISLAESCTGGLVAAALSAVPGASQVFDRGFVVYANAAKIEMLGVKASDLERFGAVSEAVAKQMAQGALEHSHANLSVSITGIAGPGGSEHKPEGRVWFGLAQAGCAVYAESREFGAIGRDFVRNAACNHALALLQKAATQQRPRR